MTNSMGNPYQRFHDIMDELIDSFDANKSAGFEARIRDGPKKVWMQTDEARSHLLYRMMCKLILMVAASSELPEQMIYEYFVKDPTEVFIKEEAHAAKKAKKKKCWLIWALSFSDNLLCKFLFEKVPKNLINQFQRDVVEGAFSAIGIGHDDKGLENALMRLMSLHRADGSGEVTTDDASNWDISTSRDGFMFAAMALFPALVGGAGDHDMMDVLPVRPHSTRRDFRDWPCLG